jgi:hypothetical protein
MNAMSDKQPEHNLAEIEGMVEFLHMTKVKFARLNSDYELTKSIRSPDASTLPKSGLQS